MTPQEQKDYDRQAASDRAEAAKREREEADHRARALTAATALFQTKLTNLPMMMAQNAAAGRSPLLGLSPGADGAKGVAGAAMAGAAIGLVMTLGKVIGDGLQRLLSAPTSGMTVFNKSLELLTASIAPVLLPVVFLLSVAMAAAAEVIFGESLPAFQQLADLLVTVGLPAVSLFVAMLQWAATQIKIAIAGMMGALHAAGIRGVPAPVAALIAVGGAAGKGNGGGVGDAMRNAIGDVLGELKLLTMSTPVSSGGPASAFNRAQQAVLGQSPFERSMLDRVTKGVAIIEKAVGTWLGIAGKPATTNDRKGGK